MAFSHHGNVCPFTTGPACALEIISHEVHMNYVARDSSLTLKETFTTVHVDVPSTLMATVENKSNKCLSLCYIDQKKMSFPSCPAHTTAFAVPTYTRVYCAQVGCKCTSVYKAQ